MHTVDWRTKRGTSRARCANPDCRARQTNYVKKKYVQGSIVTIQLLGAAVARRFAREGLTVAVARYLCILFGVLGVFGIGMVYLLHLVFKME